MAGGERVSFMSEVEPFGSPRTMHSIRSGFDPEYAEGSKGVLSQSKNGHDPDCVGVNSA